LGQIIYAGTKWNSRATYAHTSPPDYMRPTPHFLLVYTLEGEANYVDDTGVKAVLRKGMLVWARPGVNQSYGPKPGVRWSEFFMWFGGPLFDTWQTHGFPGEHSRLLNLEPLEYWIKRFRDLVESPPATPVKNPLVQLCRLQQILADALQIEEVGRHTAAMTVWRETVCGRLAEGTLTSPSLTKIAASMHMSYTLFRKRFLELTGATPSQYRTVEIIRRACGRLLETDDPLYQIAADLGFHDPFHFSRRFKQVVGLSPSDFRRQIRRQRG
jgi:AraC-like DNA-binding protein